MTRRHRTARSQSSTPPGTTRNSGCALGVEADHVLFGHTHRMGPRANKDDASEWLGANGTRLWNTGNWVWEPAFTATRPPRSGYWPGAAIELDDQGDPRPVHLLGHRTHEDLTPPARLPA